MAKIRIKRALSILLVVALAAGILPLPYGRVSCAAAGAGIQVSDLPPYPSNGQKFWVVFTEGFRNERLEMATCDISGYEKYAYIVWDRSLLLRGANDTGKYNQYCLNESGNWEQIGSYQRFTDYAVTVIASNLDIYDAYGNKIISKTENYGIKNSDIFGELININPQRTTAPRATATPRVTATPKITAVPRVTGTPRASAIPKVTATPEPKATVPPRVTETPRQTAVPRVTAVPRITESPNVTSDPYGTAGVDTTSDPYGAEEPQITWNPYEAEEPEMTPEPYGTEEPQITQGPYEAEEPEVTPEPYGTEEPQITQGPYEAEESKITPEPYGTAEPDATPNISDISKDEGGADLPEVSSGNQKEESENPFDGEENDSDERKKMPEQGKIVTVGAVKYIVKKSAKSQCTVFAYAPKQKSASKIVVPEKVIINGYTFKVTGINKNAFKNMKRLSSVKLGKNIKTIGGSAFQNCRRLRNIIIPQNVVSIGANAFAGSRLNYLNVKSKKINMLGLGAFYNTGKKVVVVTSGAKRRQYMRMFVSQGRMSRKAIFLTS